MTDVRALEAKVRRDMENASTDDLDLLARHYWQAALAEPDYRNRRKLLKRSSHYAGQAFKSGLEDPDALRLYMDITRRAAEAHSFPQDERRKLSQITARWLALTGAREHSVLAQAKGKVATETATFGLGDVGLAPGATEDPWSERAMVEWMNQGQRLFFNTGYDGVIKAELRVIDGTEPVLSEKEYRKLGSATPSIVLAVPSGRLALADHAVMTKPWQDAPPEDTLTIEAEPGTYKACVFGFSTSRWDSAIAVLCPTAAAPANKVAAVDSLFM